MNKYESVILNRDTKEIVTTLELIERLKSAYNTNDIKDLTFFCDSGILEFTRDGYPDEVRFGEMNIESHSQTA